MGLKCVLVWLMLMLIFISLEGWKSEGCFKQERFALLQLRHFFNDPKSLRDWVEGDGNSDCCQWQSVVCSNTTGKVISLSLSYTRNYKSGERYLNVSMFSPFQELEELDLNFNLIAGCVEYEGFEKLSHLNNLQVLYLDDNMFNDSSILSALSQHSSLKELRLRSNGLRELNHFNVSRLSNLEYLDLSGNNFNNSIISSLASLSSLKVLDIDNIGLEGTVDLQEWDSLTNLETLRMDDNKINKILFPKGLRKLNELFLWNMSISNGSSLLQSLGSFPSLKTVYLSYINFSETITTHVLPTFNNLEKLYIYEAIFNNNFVQIIGAITSLKTLSIVRCNLKDTKFDQVLPTFNNLEELTLEFTVFNNNFVQIIRAMTSLKSLLIDNCDLKDTKFDQVLPTFNNLKELYIRETVLNNNTVQIIGAMTSLKTLRISRCNLTNIFLEQGICKLLHLQGLYITNNDLGGTLPWCLANLTSLQVLDISSNHFTGNISSSPLIKLIAIQELWLSDNHFQIPMSLEPFFNHSKLKSFYGENNEVYVGIESHSLVPTFQLNSIILSNCGNFGSFPKFLYSQHELQEVDLSHNNLSGEFPNWLLDNNTKLDSLILVNNSLSGPFRLPIHSHMFLIKLDISVNFFHGHIPMEIGTYLQQLNILNMSRNAFNGSIPSSFGLMNSMEYLDLSNNLLMGKIPEHLAMGCFSLQLLALSNNSLQGQIFSTNFNLTKLSVLLLDKNNFTGEISNSLSKCFLRGLYLNENNLSSMIPRWLGNMSNLVDIIMSKNLLEGPIPLELCQLEYLEVLDLSENNITGSLPLCFHSPPIKRVHLRRNKLQGKLNDIAFFNSTSLMTLDLGYNHFEGSIPAWIGRFSKLTYLILRNNNIQGEVPIQLCQLDQLRLLDLSHNNLFGYIPSCLNISITPTASNFSLNALNMLERNSLLQSMRKEETLEFTTKKISYLYEERILTIMSGIDLSCNKLTGEIPLQIGALVGIHSLNLSHNNLTGQIPSTFSNLKQIESLDLSYNNLNGSIPPQLVELNALAIFIIAYNNLSGKIPEWTRQFATFEASSYKGNPLLCGQPLPKSCNAIDPPSIMPKASLDNEEDEEFIDMDIFYISFVVTYIIVLLGIFIILFINPQWHHTWFYIIEIWTTSCYYFVIDHLPR